MRERVDKWAAGEPDKPVRSEAIRRLMELALRALNQRDRAVRKLPIKRPNWRAGKSTVSATSPQPTTNGKVGSSDSLRPKEFRDIRGDPPKAKGK